MSAATILGRIVASARQRVAEASREVPLAQARDQPVHLLAVHLARALHVRGIVERGLRGYLRQGVDVERLATAIQIVDQL